MCDCETRTINSALYLPCYNTRTLGFCIAATANLLHLKSTHSSFRSCITFPSYKLGLPYIRLPILSYGDSTCMIIKFIALIGSIFICLRLVTIHVRTCAIASHISLSLVQYYFLHEFRSHVVGRNEENGLGR